MPSLSFTSLTGELHQALLDGTPKQLEQLAADLLSAFLNTSFYVARAGFQHGADAGTSGNADQNLRVECKRYSDTNPLDDRELRGEIDDALLRNPDLDAWILVSTRAVSETTRDVLHLKSEDVGLPVVVLDWTPVAGQLPDLAALCAFSPEIVEAHYGADAAQLARALSGQSTFRLEALKRHLELSYIGYHSIKALADRRIESMWTSEAEAKAQFAQNIAIGVSRGAIERMAVSDGLESWWTNYPDRPAVVLGEEGVGKTWAIVHWVHRKLRDLPIVMLIPSSAFREIHGLSVASVQEFVAGELHTLAGSRTKTFWRRRIDQIVRRKGQGAGFLLLMDGLNQDPSFQWTRLLEIFQGNHFSRQLRVVASLQRHYFEQDLRQLSGLIHQPKQVPVLPYDLSPGGELDEMLRLHGLKRADLAPRIVELARNPRMFSLVVRFREDIATQGDATVVRLLWAYGRDELRMRPERPFTDGEWEEWLRGLAIQLRDADAGPFDAAQRGRKFSLNELSRQVQQPHRTPEDTQRRLNEIVAGKWMEPVPGSSHSYRPRAEIITLALGLGLVEHLGGVEDATVGTELSRLLDPIRATSSTAEILAAAVPIAVSTGARESVTTAIVTELLQSQNASDDDRAEILAMAPLIVDPILDAVERSGTRAHASARRWAIAAIHHVPEDNDLAWNQIHGRLRAWMATTDCPTLRERSTNDGSAEHRSKTLLEKLGTDKPGSVTALGVVMTLWPSDHPYLGDEVPRILQGRRLDKLVEIFKAAAISRAIGTFRTDGWTGLKWLVTFDARSRIETVAAIVKEVDALLARPPEAHVQPELRERVAAMLLWLTAEPELEARAQRIDPTKLQFLNYEKDYLQNPAHSYLALERRHLNLVVANPAVPALQKARRVKRFLPDPTFAVPDALRSDVARAAAEFDLSKLKIGRFYTAEDHDFDEFLPLAARIAPEALALLARRLLRALDGRQDEWLYSLCTAAPEYLLLAGRTELEVIRSSRLRCAFEEKRERCYARMQLLECEVAHLSAYEQLCAIAGDPEAWLTIRLFDCTSPCTAEEVDRFLAEHDLSDRRAIDVLLNHLTRHVVAITNGTFQALVPFVDERFADDLHVIALMALANCAPIQLGKRLFARNWKFSDDQTLLEMDWGSIALVAACAESPLLDLQNAVAPWRLLEEARRRGDRASLNAVARSLSEAMLPKRWEGSEPPAVLSVEAHGQTGRVSISQLEDDNEDISKALDLKYQRERWQETQDRGREYLDHVRRRGAVLHGIAFKVEDVIPLVRECRLEVDAWLDGCEERSAAFRGRVNLASGLYLALCEALLAVDPERGAILWHSLESMLPIRFVGTAEISEIVHILFRVPDSPHVAALRNEFFSIQRIHNEKNYFELVIAAMAGGSEAWLQSKVAADESSGTGWRLKRAAMLRGMMERPKLGDLVWPEGEPVSSLDDVQRTALSRKNAQALAYHWWRTFLEAKNADEAYAAWVLFLQCADRRCWVWLGNLISAHRPENETVLWLLKMSHVEANLGELKKAMNDNEQSGTTKMDRSLFGWDSPADFIDMQLLGGLN